ncbi:hypothetical protein [Leeuwenhoekiella sp. ZYFB001]|uniref:hypothetical protein n=1 Tax=Leeuwenhoekiella sp. ZYFB001 TaxID=2719912 RepID=UPI001431080A|nr:hypothetical protein [Leeuwenhoekiella sp. ZYFB001]
MNKSTHNSAFDLSQFEKIEDIIYLDEPILTHLTRNGKHFLLYLVDTIERIDIYLMFELEETVIFAYLTKQISLKDVITSNKNFIYKIEQDFEGVIKNTSLTQSNILPDSYLPAEDSYLTYEPTNESYYYKLIKDFESKSYLRTLQKEAFYIRLAPTNDKYADTIGFNELAGYLLKNISASFKSFLKADFFESFKHQVSDQKKLNSLFSRLSEDLDYRMVDLNFRSFEIGLAVDKIMKKSIQDNEVRGWAMSVGYKYKDIVLDDYDEKAVKNIIYSYTEEDRKKIFEPIFKITENPNFQLQVKNSKSKPYSRINVKDKAIIEKILPPITTELKEDKHKEYEIIQVTTIKEKDKLRKTIRLDENTLFESSNTKQYILKKNDFAKFNFDLNYNVNIPLDISTQDGKIILSTNYQGIDFSKTIDAGKFDEGLRQIINSIYEYIVNKEE